MSNADVYDAARQRITELARNADLNTAVGACPGWTVGDVVAHLAGGLADFTERRFDGVDTGEWGERQVRERRGRSLDDSLTEWALNRQAADGLFDSPMGPILVTEIVSHEQDIRTALGRPGERDNVAVRSALTRPLQEVDKRMRSDGLPALRVELEHGTRVLGEGEPAGTLRVSSFELLRTIAGRRSLDQMRTLAWDGDPEPWLGVFSLFGERRQALVE
ncbi:maleylpyruvate isomerase family mycothiol-dependent enzyme [Solihabitans fulvus]|uniref:Maleylpyruvate isomerase family mycothiol-dependent enzyme n=1 Tax=Solihabitans fulvus TaxID=1892852 RepID=A0A5B2WTB7_9PSEU|nr:maleylpyruvate isomerase family mycothiol-dependent enzyme [Solihabitans fulvus]KAA2254070.1 maleylpyruvate isomerase family mycothiol-dependent enzyme [Solihabitans fulvus]